MLALALVLEGADRTAARACGMDLQTLRDWVHRDNAEGLAGLSDHKAPGRAGKLTPEQKQALPALVEARPDADKDGVVRWRRVDQGGHQGAVRGREARAHGRQAPGGARLRAARRLRRRRHGGPVLEAPADFRPVQCKHCRHWKSPFRASSGPTRPPASTCRAAACGGRPAPCDRVLIGNSRVPAFSATVGEFGYRNFEAAPLPPMPKGGGFVTIRQNGRVVWHGREEEIPARFLEQDLDL